MRAKATSVRHHEGMEPDTPHLITRPTRSHRARWRALGLGLVVVLATSATACGGSSGGSDGAATTAAPSSGDATTTSTDSGGSSSAATVEGAKVRIVNLFVP